VAKAGTFTQKGKKAVEPKYYIYNIRYIYNITVKAIHRCHFPSLTPPPPLSSMTEFSETDLKNLYSLIVQSVSLLERRGGVFAVMFVYRL